MKYFTLFFIWTIRLLFIYLIGNTLYLCLSVNGTIREKLATWFIGGLIILVLFIFFEEALPKKFFPKNNRENNEEDGFPKFF